MGSSSSSSSSTGGIGSVGLLTIVFIVLKLTGFIGWSWIWVLSPIWISLILEVVIFTIAILVVTSSGRAVKRNRIGRR